MVFDQPQVSKSREGGSAIVLTGSDPRDWRFLLPYSAVPSFCAVGERPWEAGTQKLLNSSSGKRGDILKIEGTEIEGEE